MLIRLPAVEAAADVGRATAKLQNIFYGMALCPRSKPRHVKPVLNWTNISFTKLVRDIRGTWKKFGEHSWFLIGLTFASRTMLRIFVELRRSYIQPFLCSRVTFLCDLWPFLCFSPNGGRSLAGGCSSSVWNITCCIWNGQPMLWAVSTVRLCWHTIRLRSGSDGCPQR